MNPPALITLTSLRNPLHRCPRAATDAVPHVGKDRKGQDEQVRFRERAEDVPQGARPGGTAVGRQGGGRGRVVADAVAHGGAVARVGVFREAGVFERELVSMAFKPVPGSKVGELMAKFDIVVGRTPADKS